ncbi:uncharacterized protein Dvar_74840 [Desulfosarcina variabilis str. Montpellier]|jgi:hypothetical protein|uniref:hypothetical protein n=1 Tax=Desulfosarcina variabilis TaxID=2300 RepID=UPI003AFA7B51
MIIEENTYTETEFDESAVVTKILIDRNGHIDIRPEKGAQITDGDLRESEKISSRVLWFDVFKKNPTTIRIYYMTPTGDKRYVDVIVYE